MCNRQVNEWRNNFVPCSLSGQQMVICQWFSILWVSISLCLNRLSITALALPVYLSHWPPLWRATGAECSRQPRGQALTRPASKLRLSLPRVELPQATSLSTGVVCSDKEAASWSKHTHIKRKGRQQDRWRETKGVGGKRWSGITGIICLKSDLLILKGCGGVWVCFGICLMDIQPSWCFCNSVEQQQKKIISISNFIPSKQLNISGIAYGAHSPSGGVTGG